MLPHDGVPTFAYDEIALKSSGPRGVPEVGLPATLRGVMPVRVKASWARFRNDLRTLCAYRAIACTADAAVIE